MNEDLSIKSIRNLLWEEIHNLKDGNTSAANLSAITNASGKILSTVVMQMKYAQMTGQKMENMEGVSSFIEDKTNLLND